MSDAFGVKNARAEVFRRILSCTRQRVSTAKEFGNGLGAGPNLKFLIDPPNIGMDGFVTDPELFGDFFIEETLAKAVEDLLFALG